MASTQFLLEVLTMLMNSMKIRKALAIVMLAGAGFHSPIAAEESAVADCYERVMIMCVDALDEARWWEKPAVGLLCTAMLGGCMAEVF
jgi:hypothetical protein